MTERERMDGFLFEELKCGNSRAFDKMFKDHFKAMFMNQFSLVFISLTIIGFLASAQDIKPSPDITWKQPKLNILTLGDSNGAADFGWPQQLRKLLPSSTVINKSISGNTIGFDNLNQEKLNTLKNITRYLDEAYRELTPQNNFDAILINLGTNDTKCIFEHRQKEVPSNMVLLMQKIRKYMTDNQKICPSICIITPSPMDEQKVNKEKYSGGDQRIQKNNQKFKKIAAKNQTGFLDTYTHLKPGFKQKTEDGVHLNEKTQVQMASEIVNYLKLRNQH
jgi:lysophospholipase L1-like esterase